MSDLAMPADICRGMIDAAREAAPMEACGLLAGRRGRVARLYVLTNADRSPVHYTMLPDEQFAAVRDMRERGLRLLAIWHSHPGAPAGFSQEDLRLAYTPDVVYVTLSLLHPEAPEIRAFEVVNGVPATIEVVIDDEDT